MVLVDGATSNVVFANKAAKKIEIKTEGVMSWNWDNIEENKRFSLTKKAFARLNKTVFVENMLHPESAIAELEKHDEYESLQQIIEQETV